MIRTDLSDAVDMTEAAASACCENASRGTVGDAAQDQIGLINRPNWKFCFFDAVQEEGMRAP